LPRKTKEEEEEAKEEEEEEAKQRQRNPRANINRPNVQEGALPCCTR